MVFLAKSLSIIVMLYHEIMGNKEYKNLITQQTANMRLRHQNKLYIGRKHAVLLLESHGLGKMFFIMDLKTSIISL